MPRSVLTKPPRARRLAAGLLREERGQTLFEYAAVLFLIAVVTAGVIQLLGGDIAGLLDDAAGMF